MMPLCDMAERTKKTWRGIIEAAGLVLCASYISKDGVSESVLEVERK
jgi:hypothetical protein